uniref:Receptor interacting serine/threonine kinase 3 n=1 Tax=Sphenodon punctatus TaxID=8508 RepID=A0A8D0L6N1_SPHPU
MSVPSKFREWIPRQHMSGLQLVGQGGFGTIYRARHKDWGIDVAVKILSRDSTCTRKELLAEARAMEVARFPFILRLFGLYAEELEEAGLGDQSLIPRGLGIVMEFMERGSLLSLLRQVRHVPWALRFRILHQVGLGMNYLHGLNPPLLHLDLKPSNILLNGELHVRLADFGLSKFKRGMTQQDAASSKEQVYEHGGTLEYMPPEAFTDINYKPATATDVYSYGILTWSVLAGEEPYANLHAEMLSTMLRIHIPLGQRPSTEELEKVTNVQGLDNMIKLMKSCWDTEKTCSPSFQECRTETEEIFLLHESYVGVIVLEVLRHLTGSASDKSSTSGMSSAPPGSIRSAPYSSSRESLGISECFKTLHLKEPPSYQNGFTVSWMNLQSHGALQKCSARSSLPGELQRLCQ